MAQDILMPKMGESVQEGTILRWLKKEGDAIERDEIIAEISTDKVDTEIPSPSAGTLLKIVAQENETVPVGAVIAQLGEAGDAAAATQPAITQVPTPKAPEPAATTNVASSGPQAAATPVQQQTGGAASNGGDATTSRIEILMPKMGESVQEGTILKWLKKTGDVIERDEIIAEISTDKVDTEIPSPSAGTLSEIVAQENETVAVGTVIAYLSGKSAATAAPQVAKPVIQQTSSTPQSAEHVVPIAAASTASAVETQSAHTPVPRVSNGKFYSPLVRTIADKEGIAVAELDALQGTGAGSRVTKSDVLDYISRRSTLISTKLKTGQTAGASPATSGVRVQAPTQAGPDTEIVPMDRMRQLIAEHMVRSKQTSPHVTMVGEADVTQLVRLRESQKDAFKAREGINLTYTPFFIAAIAQALRDNPWVNASVEGTNIILKKRVNVGVATALPDGNLIVPVVKDADRMNVAGLAHSVSDLAARARNKSLTPDEISGGTFTLTNYGVFGLLHGAPIINQPQVAILGTGAIQKRPVVRSFDDTDVVVIRSMVYLTLSHDHRIVDGLLGGKFLSDIIRNLESVGETTQL